MCPVFVPVNKDLHNFRHTFFADSVSFAATFHLYLWKSHLSLISSLLLSKTSLACLSCSFVNAFTTDKLRYQLVLVMRKAAPVFGVQSDVPRFCSRNNTFISSNKRYNTSRQSRGIVIFVLFCSTGIEPVGQRPVTPTKCLL